MFIEPYEMDDRFLEYSHDYVHYFVNGDMEDRYEHFLDTIIGAESCFEISIAIFKKLFVSNKNNINNRV